MKTRLQSLLIGLALIASATVAPAQTTAFTYQGRLHDGTGPANGTYNLRFALFDALTVGNPVGSPLTNAPVNVSNGLFSVTLDFGNQFPGADRWLEIGVRPNGGGAFTNLIPRQPITATPYAITAGNLSVALPSANLSGTYWNPVILNNAANSFSGNGSNLTALNASQLASGTVPVAALSNAWKLGGNTDTAGSVLGTVDSQPMKFISGNSRVLSLETKVVVSPRGGVVSTAVNVLGGANINTIASNVTGATIGGGGSSDFNGFFTVPNPNTVLDAFGTVGGGLNNTAGSVATVAGGEGNLASGSHSFIGGGLNNLAAGSSSFAAGNRAKANHDGAFVWADSTAADFASTAANQFAIRASGGVVLSGSTPNLSFGNTTRQMLNLFEAPDVFNSSYGIGVQPDVLYFRTRGGSLGWGNFSWYIGGSHSDTAFDPGGNFLAPAREQMRLDSSGQLTVYGSTGNGVHGISSSAGARAVYGENLSGGGFGVAGRTTGTGIAVYGDNASPSGWAGNFNGGVFVGGNLSFGTSSLRQMLDLWAGEHGIGVQAWTTYFRTIGGGANGAFAWYKGGVHADNQLDAGGGTTLMNLDSSGLNVAGNVAYTGQLNKLDVAESFEARVRAADLFLGHSSRRGTPGRALVDNTDTLHLNFASDWANTYIGGNNVSVCTLTIRGGCDIAEPFQMSNKEIPKGAVVVIDEDKAGHLKMSDRACDTRVAGIISGANGVNTGVTLTQEGVMEGDQNVALSGRVYVQADAANGPIKPGDLLTTSAVPGHAMKVTDHAKAQGAILGKAMTGLAQGRGMVLVLVTLQ